MTPTLLTGLVAFGLLVLIGVAFTAHRMEVAKVDRIRRAGLHRDRYRDLSFIVDVVPYKPIQGELPPLLTRSMVMHLEAAIEMDGGGPEIRRQLKSARALDASVSKGGAFPQKEHGGSIGDQLSNVQRGIKLLKEFILQQHRGGFLSKQAATAYIKGMHEVNLTATVDGLLGQARHTLSEGNKTLGLRYFQLAYNEISKSKSAGKYISQLEEIAAQIKLLKADQKAVQNATQEINQKLANSISPRKDDDDSFEMQQIS